MRAVVQLVSKASVTVDGETVGEIGHGLLVLLGVGREDSTKDAEFLSKKIVGLRIFADQNGLMNKSLVDVGGQMLVVSQFTLYGDCRKGRRPSYNDAAPPEQANTLYEYFMERVHQEGIAVQSGTFQAMMEVQLTNQGPVTIILDSKKNS